MTTTANPSTYDTAFGVLTALGTDRDTTTGLLALLDTPGVEAVTRLPHHTSLHTLFEWLPDLDAAALAVLTGLAGHERFVAALQAVVVPAILEARPTAAEIAEAEAYLAARPVKAVV